MIESKVEQVFSGNGSLRRRTQVLAVKNENCSAFSAFDPSLLVDFLKRETDAVLHKQKETNDLKLSTRLQIHPNNQQSNAKFNSEGTTVHSDSFLSSL